MKEPRIGETSAKPVSLTVYLSREHLCAFVSSYFSSERYLFDTVLSSLVSSEWVGAWLFFAPAFPWRIHRRFVVSSWRYVADDLTILETTATRLK
jgi:hypothetical protein